jgi:hypothetical protein
MTEQTAPTEVPQIDHAGEAQAWLEGAERREVNLEATTAFASIAQAHATLALAEEQRTASLVAYFAILNDIYTASPQTAEPQGLQRLSDIVWERLGL